MRNVVKKNKLILSTAASIAGVTLLLTACGKPPENPTPLADPCQGNGQSLVYAQTGGVGPGQQCAVSSNLQPGPKNLFGKWLSPVQTDPSGTFTYTITLGVFQTPAPHIQVMKTCTLTDRRFTPPQPAVSDQVPIATMTNDTVNLNGSSIKQGIPQTVYNTSSNQNGQQYQPITFPGCGVNTPIKFTYSLTEATNGNRMNFGMTFAEGAVSLTFSKVN